jgi:hypothetical protein
MLLFESVEQDKRLGCGGLVAVHFFWLLSAVAARGVGGGSVLPPVRGNSRSFSGGKHEI